jgi:hypothetical protein
MAMASSSLIAGTVLVEGAGTFTASDARVFGEVRAATMDTDCVRTLASMIGPCNARPRQAHPRPFGADHNLLL